MSFRLKTILGIALIEGSLLLLLVWSSLQYVTSSSGNELMLRATTIAESMGHLSRDAILATDLARLESVAQQALSSPDLVYVRFLNADVVLAESGSSEVLRRPFREDASFDEVRDGILDVGINLREGGFDIGRVELGLSVDRAALLISQARAYLSGIALGEMLLVALFSFILGTYLTRGLDGLKRAAVAISRGEPDVRVELKGSDELAETGSAFNEMSTRLAAAQRSMQRSVQESQALAAQLAERELRLSTILSTAVDGFITIDEHGVIEDLNQAAGRLFGYAKEELIGQNVSCLMEEPHRSSHDDYIANYLITGVAGVIGQGRRVQGLRKDGSLFPIDLTVSEMKLDGHHKFVGLVRDLTDQVAAEAIARRSEVMRGAIVDANLDGLITVDSEDRIVDFSRVAEEMFGYSFGEVVGQEMGELIIPPEMREKHHQGMQRYLDTGEGPVLGRRIEVEALRADRTRFPVELAVQATEIDGELHFIAFVRDISKRKAEEQILLDAKQKAEVASEAKSRFLAHMSHEIRSPLNAVLGSLELLLEDALSERQNLYARTAESSGKLLLGLINDVLDFSKIEAGQLQLGSGDFSLRALVDEVVDVVAQRARLKGLYVAAVVHPAVSDSLCGDMPRLRQVLGNLLDNAIKFTERGAVVLYVEPVEAMDQTGKLRFTVEDSGIGIAPEAQEGLFEEFQQVDSSDSTAHGGTGLGLAVCLGLVELMGGVIGLQSEPGRGSRFWVEVPLAHGTGADAAATPPVVDPLTLTAVGLPGLLQEALHRFCDWNGCQLFVESELSKALSAIPEGTDVLLVGAAQDQDAIEGLARSAREQGARRCLLLSAEDLGESPKVLKRGVFDRLVVSPLNTPVLNDFLALTTTDESETEWQAPQLSDMRPDAAGRRLLLAEDSPANQVVARAMLEGAGYVVDVADNGAAAIERFKVGGYDAILMDLRMPEVDGLEATGLIRDLPQGKEIPIIALTANAMQEDVTRCFEAGMDDFIPKPVEKKRLLETLARHLEAASQTNHEADSLAPNEGEGNKVPLLDEQVLAQLTRDVTPEAVPDMLRMFVKEIVERADKVSGDMLGESGLEVLEDEAHTLKGCAGTFGATRLQDLAREVENACREGGAETALELGGRIDKVLQQTLQAYHDRFDYLSAESQDRNETT